MKNAILMTNLIKDLVFECLMKDSVYLGQIKLRTL